ncbi:MAG TPA: cupredoxin domain-containing protein [Roseiarcus sp.]|nr:cupredoxin domain-containing protein [Roseiarcus sp.]
MLDRYGFGIAVGTLFLLLAGGAQASTTVNVALEDPTTNSSVKHMEIRPDRTSVPAGQVTFDVKNESKSLVHEMIVVKSQLPASALPYDKKKDEVEENKIQSLGEVSELQPGKSGTLTIDMKPGAYALLCNQPGHMHNGMWVRFEVR